VRLTALAVNPATVTIPNSATGTVTLSANAPTGGFTVNLSTAQTFISIPSSVTVPAGASTATFPVTTKLVTTAGAATISAKDTTGYSASTTLTVNVPAVRLTGLAVSPTTVTAANPATGTVTLSANAPTGGFTVNLSTAQTFFSIPTTVTVPAGSSTANFTVVTQPVATAGAATIAGKDSTGYTASANFTVNVPTVRVSSLTVSPTSVNSGTSSTGTVSLTANAPTGGFVVNLSTMQSFAQLPLTVTVPSGASSATFTITTTAVTAASTATINAADTNGYKASATLTVNPQATTAAISLTDGAKFSPNSITVAAGTTVVFTNTGSILAHNVTSDVAGSGPKSQTITAGQSYSWTVPAGSASGKKFFFHCTFHGAAGNGSALGTGMAGVIIVK
jgi:plastocyanin